MDITNPRLLYLKGGLFVLLAALACTLILIEQPTLRTAALLAVAIWSAARAYYFAFYVVEHYADPGYRFAGLWSFVRYLLRKRAEPHADRSTQRAGGKTTEIVDLYDLLRGLPFPALGKQMGDFPLYDTLLAGCADRVCRGGHVQPAEVPAPDEETVRQADLLRNRSYLTEEEKAFLEYFEVLDRLRRVLRGS